MFTKKPQPEPINPDEFDLINFTGVTAISCHINKPYICLIQDYEQFILLDYEIKKCITQQRLTLMRHQNK